MTLQTKIKATKSTSFVWTAGMALFSMFFGAGNLIFPLLVGVESGHLAPFAVLGLGLSAVFFPLLGLLSMLFHQGDLQKFTRRLGVVPAQILVLVLQLAMGPFACIPRLITLMHASLHHVIPYCVPWVFSIVICLAMFFLTLRASRMVHFLGVILTPLFLMMLATLVLIGVSQGDLLQISSHKPLYHVISGLKGGYQTMDLVGSLLFATLIIPFLQKKVEGQSREETSSGVRKSMFFASLVAAFLLTICYVGLTFLAAFHARKLAFVPPEELLLRIAEIVLGPIGSLVAVTIVCLACFTTAMSLTAVFAEYVKTTFFTQSQKTSFYPLLITVTLSFLMSHLGFGGLMKAIGPAMQILYPALIALCLVNIAHSLGFMFPIKRFVYGALILGVISFFWT